MLVADELEADWSQVRVKQAPAANPYKSPVMGAQVTVASASVRGWYEPLRKAGAAGKMMLIKAAADTWKVPEAECEASKGVVKHKKGGKTFKYGSSAARPLSFQSRRAHRSRRKASSGI